MLAEKFILLLESLIHAPKIIHADGSPRCVSQSPHIPINLCSSLSAPTPIFRRQMLADMLRPPQSE
jgi:hypothetical protein